MDRRGDDRIRGRVARREPAGVSDRDRRRLRPVDRHLARDRRLRVDTNANTSVWSEGRLLAFDYRSGSATYDPDSDGWTSTGRVPIDACEDLPSSVSAGTAYGRLCGGLIRFDPERNEWRRIDPPQKDFFPDEMFGAGPTLLVEGVVDRFGGGDDVRLFAYRETGSGARSAPTPPSGSFPEPTEGVSALPLLVEETPEGNQEVSLTFADGTQMQLRFGPRVNLDGLGIRGSTLGSLIDPDDGECCGRPIEYYYGTPEQTGLLSGEILATFPGPSDGNVELRKGHPRNGADLYLVFRFGPWTALVYDSDQGGMTEAQHAAWAAGLDGIVNDDASLHLLARHDLRLEEPGFPTGPSLLIVGPQHEPEIFIYPTTCQPKASVQIRGSGTVFAEWCPEGGIAWVRATGREQFVQEVVDTLTVAPQP